MLERFTRLDLFHSVPPAQLDGLAAVSPLRVFHSGEQLLSPTDAPAPLYVILTGRVRLERRHPALTDAVELVELGAGDLVGSIVDSPAQRAQYVAPALEETDVA